VNICVGRFVCGLKCKVKDLGFVKVRKLLNIYSRLNKLEKLHNVSDELELLS
jgi:hypothetical protein